METRSAELEEKLAALTSGGKPLEPSAQNVDLLVKLVESIVLNQPKQALQLSEQALQLSRALPYPQGTASALGYKGFALYLLSEHEKAHPILLEALSLARELGEPSRSGRILNLLAGVQLSLGNYELALSHGMEALKLFRTSGDRVWEGWALHDIGAGFHEIGDYDRALDHHQQALAIFEKLDDWQGAVHGHGRALDGIGTVYKSMGNFEQAACYFRKSLVIFERLENQMGISRALNDLGEIHRQLGEFEQALDCHTQSLEIRRKIGQRQAQSTSLINLGLLYIDQKNADEALNVLHEALKIAQDVKAKPRLFQSHRALSDAYELQGNLSEALKHQRAFQQLREEVAGDETASRIKNLQISFEIENAESKAEIERLRNVELAEKNVQLKKLLDELQVTQAHLVQSEKMAALGNLVASMVHEMNSPLGSITSAADVARRSVERFKSQIEDALPVAGVENGSKLRRSLQALEDSQEVVLKGGKRLSSILGNLKSFARLDEAEFQSCDLHDGLESCLALLRRDLESGVSVVKEYGDIPRLACYASEMNQVFMNILTNALRSIEGEGTITVRTFANEGRLTIQFEDTGVGIPAEQLPTLYEPGFSRRGKRVKAGFGLFAARNIVEKHDGEIRVESEVGKGSKFTVLLPVRDSHPRSS